MGKLMIYGNQVSGATGSATELEINIPGMDAQNVDAGLSELNDRTSNISKNLSTEVARATEAEDTLSTNLSTEITRAQKAEEDITLSLNSIVAMSSTITNITPSSGTQDTLEEVTLNKPSDNTYRWYLTNIWLDVQSNIVAPSINHNGNVKLLYLQSCSSSFNITGYFIGIKII